MNKLWALLAVSLIFFTGCNKRLTNIFYRDDHRLVVNDVNFDYLSAKAKVDFESTKNSLSGTANLRLKKDSIIWISLSPGLGLEAARVLISRDSIFFISKIDKEYSQMSFVDLSEKFEFDIDFDLIQSVILGNLIYPYDREKVVKNAEMYAYNQQHGKFFFENFIGSKTMKLEKVQVRDTISKNTISVNYSDFQLVEEEIFPFKILVNLRYQEKSKGTTRVELEYKQTNIEKKPLKFPFNVPQKYEHK